MSNRPHSTEIQHLFHRGQPLAFGKGEIVLGNDDKSDGVYLISTGYIKSYSISNDGDELLHIIYGSGEIFPLVWAYLGVDTEAIFYETISDCTLWRISRTWFNTFITSNIDLSYHLSIQLAHQFKMFIARVNNLEYKKANQRVAYRLLLLANRFGTKTPEGIAIDPQLTHETYAHSINLTRESFSREVEELARQNIIDRTERRLVIKDMKALEAIANHPSVY